MNDIQADGLDSAVEALREVGLHVTTASAILGSPPENFRKGDLKSVAGGWPR